MTGKVLILGGTGRFGRHAAEAFWNAGWSVRLFDRAQDDLTSAALGVDVIVNGWNPRYPDWATEVPRLTEEVIAAAQWSGATVLIPGNVYVYGEGSDATLGTETPRAAKNPLGRIRIEMEEAYRRAGVRTIVLRAGDFIDTEASGNWFDMVLTKHLARGCMTYPGDLDTPHAWAYLPDMAEAAVGLCAMRDDLPDFADIPYHGYTLTGRQLAKALSCALDRPVKAHRMSWLPLRLMAPVSPMMRALCEMRYLWDMPHALDPEPLADLLPRHRPTPLVAALACAVGVDGPRAANVAGGAVPDAA
ncbi:epimerase [Pseudaestuariivita atlantica]|uniref:Epimerase n=1 Tax=Pseudaestuariivita atlantica TaxID=1317121 RepID=A0A0L1JNP9_9RHOB|nr:epimerase [Pseudaestuariivita atlantica]KNG93390.1 epimerase [Pseudaestuariivita atlantica]